MQKTGMDLRKMIGAKGLSTLSPVPFSPLCGEIRPHFPRTLESYPHLSTGVLPETVDERAAFLRIRFLHEYNTRTYDYIIFFEGCTPIFLYWKKEGGHDVFRRLAPRCCPGGSMGFGDQLENRLPQCAW